MPMAAFQLALQVPEACILKRPSDNVTPIDLAVQTRSCEALNALLLACSSKSSKEALEGIEQLVAAGAVPDTWAPSGQSCLMIAAAADNADAIKMLLQHGASRELQDALGRTALMWAAGSSAPASLNALLDAGACVATRDRRGKSALDYAADYPETKKVLESRVEEMDRRAKEAQDALLAELLAEEEKRAVSKASKKARRKAAKERKRAGTNTNAESIVTGSSIDPNAAAATNAETDEPRSKKCSVPDEATNARSTVVPKNDSATKQDSNAHSSDNQEQKGSSNSSFKTRKQNGSGLHAIEEKGMVERENNMSLSSEWCTVGRKGNIVRAANVSSNEASVTAGSDAHCNCKHQQVPHKAEKRSRPELEHAMRQTASEGLTYADAACGHLASQNVSKSTHQFHDSSGSKAFPSSGGTLNEVDFGAAEGHDFVVFDVGSHRNCASGHRRCLSSCSVASTNSLFSHGTDESLQSAQFSDRCIIHRASVASQGTATPPANYNHDHNSKVLYDYLRRHSGSNVQPSSQKEDRSLHANLQSKVFSALGSNCENRRGDKLTEDQVLKVDSESKGTSWASIAATAASNSLPKKNFNQNLEGLEVSVPKQAEPVAQIGSEDAKGAIQHSCCYSDAQEGKNKHESSFEDQNGTLIISSLTSDTRHVAVSESFECREGRAASVGSDVPSDNRKRVEVTGSQHNSVDAQELHNLQSEVQKLRMQLAALEVVHRQEIAAILQDAAQHEALAVAQSSQQVRNECIVRFASLLQSCGPALAAALPSLSSTMSESNGQSGPSTGTVCLGHREESGRGIGYAEQTAMQSSQSFPLSSFFNNTNEIDCHSIDCNTLGLDSKASSANIFCTTEGQQKPSETHEVFGLSANQLKGPWDSSLSNIITESKSECKDPVVDFSLKHKVMDHSSPFVGSGSASPLSTSPYELGDFFRTEVRGHRSTHDVSAAKISSKTNEVSIWKDESLKIF